MRSKLLPNLLLLFFLSFPSRADDAVRFYTPYIDVIPLNSSGQIDVELFLDEQLLTFPYTLGSDAELAALKISQPMGKSHAEVWALAADIKRRSKNAFTTSLADNYENDFIVHEMITYVEPNRQYHGFVHASVLDQHMAVKFYNFSAAHFAPSMIADVASLFMDEYKATPTSARNLAKQFQLLGAAPANWTGLNHATLVPHLPLLTQPDYDQSQRLPLLNDYNLPRSLRLPPFTTSGVLDVDNPDRVGETVSSTIKDHSDARVVAILRALQALSPSPLPPAVLDIRGMSSPHIRLFLNRLLTELPPPLRYLEVGTYQGSTLVSSLHGNEGSVDVAVAIDNFAEFDSDNTNFATLQTNLKRHVNLPSSSLHFLKKDFLTVQGDLRTFPPFNVYFYDGPHSREDHYESVMRYVHFLDDSSVFVVDDYNQQRVRDGTQQALVELQERGDITLTAEWIVESRWNGDLQGWWDGLAIFVIRKGGASEAEDEDACDAEERQRVRVSESE